VRLSLTQDDLRPALFADRVGSLELDSLRFPQVPGVTQPLWTTNVRALNMRGLNTTH
jgi:hypothetical protein